MTIWWSKATWLLEFSRSCRKSARRRSRLKNVTPFAWRTDGQAGGQAGELGILVVGYIVKVKRFADFAQSAGKVCQSWRQNFQIIRGFVHPANSAFGIYVEINIHMLTVQWCPHPTLKQWLFNQFKIYSASIARHRVVNQTWFLAFDGKTFPPFVWTSALMNKFTDLLELFSLDFFPCDFPLDFFPCDFSLDFFPCDFPLDSPGIFLLNFRNWRRQVLQIFLRKHNFPK